MNFAHDSAKNTRRMEERRDLEYSYKTCRLSTDTKDTIGRIYDAYSAKGGERAYFVPFWRLPVCGCLLARSTIGGSTCARMAMLYLPAKRQARTAF